MCVLASSCNNIFQLLFIDEYLIWWCLVPVERLITGVSSSCNKKATISSNYFYFLDFIIALLINVKSTKYYLHSGLAGLVIYHVDKKRLFL